MCLCNLVWIGVISYDCMLWVTLPFVVITPYNTHLFLCCYDMNLYAGYPQDEVEE